MIKLSDFGTAKLAVFGGVCATTANVVGTVPYMSPESITGKYSEASDIWALGISFVELCTEGGDVWQRLNCRDSFQMLLKIGSFREGEQYPEIPPQLSVAAKAVIFRCLADRPSDRPTRLPEESVSYSRFRRC